MYLNQLQMKNIEEKTEGCMDAVIDWAKQIFAICIFSEILINLVPTQKYQEYIKFVCTLLITLICITPLINFVMGSSADEKLYNYFSDMQEIEELKNELDFDINAQEDKSFEVYQEMVVQNIEKMVLEENMYPIKTHVVIDWDKESDTYCEIQLITINVETDKTKSNSDNTAYNILPEEAKRLKQKIADYYEINISNVNIYLEQG